MISELVKNELEELQQEYTGFRVTDLDTANWCFRKLQALKHQKNEFENLAQAEMDRIQNWLEARLQTLIRQEEFFNNLLQEYALVQRAADPKFKISTPYGKVSFRKQQPKWNYKDETVLNSLKAASLTDFIKIKEEVNKAELKKAAKVVNGNVLIADTGELIEGIEVVEQPEAIKIEVEL